MPKIFIIAEAGVNHNGSIERAHQLVEKAAEAGADAVKFQTFKASALTVKGAPQASYQSKNLGGKGDQFSMLKALELPYEAHYALKKQCETLGIEFLSTPFDTESLNFLIDDLGMSRLKIPSGEITNGPFLWECSKKKCPILLSTGIGKVVPGV